MSVQCYGCGKDCTDGHDLILGRPYCEPCSKVFGATAALFDVPKETSQSAVKSPCFNCGKEIGSVYDRIDGRDYCSECGRLYRAKQVEDTKVEGAKYDQGKVRLDLLPPELLFGIGEIFTFGAQKYSEYNWAKGIKYSRVFAAMMRHMWKWWARKGLDDESGKSHLWHAGCCLAMLIAYEQRDMTKFDDRPQATFDKAETDKATERHKDFARRELRAASEREQTFCAACGHNVYLDKDGHCSVCDRVLKAKEDDDAETSH